MQSLQHALHLAVLLTLAIIVFASIYTQHYLHAAMSFTLLIVYLIDRIDHTF